MGNLDGKVAIVTGGGRGVGRGIALALAGAGASVAILELDPATAKTTAGDIDALGVRGLPVPCDVSDEAQIDAAVETVVRELGRIDILVNNATGTRPQDASVALVKHTPDQFQRILGVDVIGSFLCMRACHPHLKASGAGRVINLSSSAGTERSAGFAAYAAAKEGLRGLTGVAAREWGPDAITVNSLCPTALTDTVATWMSENPDVANQYLASVPLGRHGDAEVDIGRVVAFICSPDAGFITGQTFWVDGGSVIHA